MKNTMNQTTTLSSILSGSAGRLLLLVLLPLMLSGCGLFGSGGTQQGEVAEAPTAPLQLVPTFTPTVEGGEPAVEPTPVPVEPAAEEQAEPAPADDAITETTTDDAGESPADQTSEEATAEPVEESVEESAGDSAGDGSPRLFITGEIVNVRAGPGVEYGLVGSVNQGQELEITGRNPLGDWWEICCVNGQQGWVFGQLARVENAENVSIAQNIPPAPAPVAVAPAPAEPAPAEPAPAEPAPAPAEPEPAPEEPAPEEPAPPADDPCAGIGGDGCKFRATSGPAFGPNAGELRLTLWFMHSGRGNESQGSYFIGLEKDGQRIAVPDSVRSTTGEPRNSPLGQFNYDYRISAGELPGGTVAGNYTMWVIDGVGERDSQNITFTVPEGQGEVHIVWDQG